MNFDNMVYGHQLTFGDRCYVLAAYVHRFTRDHKPDWACEPMTSGADWPVHFDSDQDWLDHTRFTVKSDGTLDGRSRSCYSEPTWPDNPGLQQLLQDFGPVVSDEVKP